MNGALLVSFWLTGYCMYLLARGLGFSRGLALFAGLTLQAAPIHQAGLLGHLTKVFIGAIPLTLLALHRALDLQRSARWSIAAAGGLLLVLLTHGYQFVFTALAVGFFFLAALLWADRVGRLALIRRGLLLGAAAAILCGPLLLAIVSASRNPALDIDFNLSSMTFRPDLVWLVLPGPRSQLFHWLRPLIAQVPTDWSYEPELSVPYTLLLLCGLALAVGGRRARLWGLFSIGVVILALGPALKLLRQTYFTEYGLPIILPYALVTALPGLDFVRVPTRFMLLGSVGVGITAAYGLRALGRRLPIPTALLALGAGLLVLFETWPIPWPEQRPRPVPSFYQQLRSDPEVYGVFDLPFTPNRLEPYTSNYQLFQLVHHKGVHSAYFSRTYHRHPVFPCLFSYGGALPDVQVDGEQVDCLTNLRFELAQLGYRYVVWHQPLPGYRNFQAGSPEQQAAAELIARVFGREQPVTQDDLARVWAVQPAPTVSQVAYKLELTDNWERRGENASERWAISPAGLRVTAPRSGQATLRITPDEVYDPAGRRQLGRSGRLRVELPGRWATTVPIEVGRTAEVRLPLEPGLQTVRLTLEAGNFDRRRSPADDPLPSSFSIRRLELETH